MSALFINQSDAALAVYAGSTLRLSAAATFNGANEVHFALVRNPPDWTLYVNGTPVATLSTATWNYPTITGGMFIGMQNTVPARSINGTVDDLRVYQYAKYTGAFTPPPRLP